MTSACMCYTAGLPLQMCLDDDVDPNGPCQQYTEANDVLRDLKSNLREDKQLLMQVLASVWRKVMPLSPSLLHACLAACFARCEADVMLLVFARCEANVMLLVLPGVRLTPPSRSSVWHECLHKKHGLHSLRRSK